MGRIAAPYGVKGWVKVLPLTAEPETLLAHPQWWVRRRGGEGAWQALALQSGKRHGATLLAQLAGLADREAAAVLTGADIGVPRSELPPTAENEFYFSELVDLTVVNREGFILGRVAAVEEFGAHPVLRVVSTERAGASVLIPFVAAYVDRVDIAASRIEVDWQLDY